MSPGATGPLLSAVFTTEKDGLGAAAGRTLAVARLLAVFLSLPLKVTSALLVMVDPAVPLLTRARTVKLFELPGAMVPKEQLGTPLVPSQPLVPRTVSPAGRASLTITPGAVPGPVLVTVIV